MAVGEPHISARPSLSDLLSHADPDAVSSIARLFDSAAFSVAVFERSDEITVAYLNRSAATHAAVAPEVALGSPITDVFPHIDPKFVGRLLDDAARETGAVNLRGLLPGGAAWSLDAVALSNDRLLVIADELGGAVSSRQRLEALLGSMDAIWRSPDLKSMAPQIVEQGGRLFSGVDIGLYDVKPDHAAGVSVLAAGVEWMESLSQIPAEDSLLIRAAKTREAIETSLPSAQVFTPEQQAADAHVVRVLPIGGVDRSVAPARSVGVLVFARRGPAPFTEADRHLMEQFGKLVGLAAHRAALLAEASGSAARLQLTLDLTMAFASSHSPREVIQLLLSRTLDAVEADRATLSRIDEAELTIEATYARSGELTWVGRKFGLDWLQRQPLVRQALDTRRPVVGGQLEVAEAAPEFRDALNAIHQTATVPLMLGRDPRGLLVVSRQSDSPFGAAEISILELMGNAAMLALRNARLMEDLKSANAAKSEFFNLAAHELRTPVTVIKGYTSMLQADALGPADRNKAFGVIEDKADELAKLVDTLLLAARLQAAHPIGAITSFDTAEAVSESIQRATAYASLRAGTIHADLPRDDVIAVGDPESVGRILDNLLNNAIAYSKTEPRINVRLSRGAAGVDIDVEDQGAGIPVRLQADIFDPFFRIETDMRSTGAGLGLYISKRLAESMGGDLLLVRSEPDVGSVFRLRLRHPEP